jgi:hypothetical protein
MRCGNSMATGMIKEGKKGGSERQWKEEMIKQTDKEWKR